jgi:hypothetical protein
LGQAPALPSFGGEGQDGNSPKQKFRALTPLNLKKHSTFNIQHSTFNIQHSTFNIQHSTFNIQHSTFNIQHRTTGGALGVEG